MPGGRKSLMEELQIVKRYAELSPKFFEVLTKYLASEDKNDNKWAVEQLGKAFVKMIPQDMNMDIPEGLKIVINRYGGTDNNNQSS